jgi:hypothetical protein
VARISSHLDKENGRFSALLLGVIESAPFQRTRNPAQNFASDSRPAKIMLK